MILGLLTIALVSLLGLNYLDYRRGYKDGANTTSHITTYSYKEISILTEEKNCKEQGGTFKMYNPFYDYQSAEDLITISCVSPEKELFSYKIK